MSVRLTQQELTRFTSEGFNLVDVVDLKPTVNPYAFKSATLQVLNSSLSMVVQPQLSTLPWKVCSLVSFKKKVKKS